MYQKFESSSKELTSDDDFAVALDPLSDLHNLNRALLMLGRCLDTFIVSKNHPIFNEIDQKFNTLRSKCLSETNRGLVEELVSVQKEVLVLIPMNHPQRPIALANLGDALIMRYDQFGGSQYLDEAISIYREVLQLRRSARIDPIYEFHRLSKALVQRFQQSGTTEVLDEAIFICEEALTLYPYPHPHSASSLQNLATAFVRRYERMGSMEDLERGIVYARQSLLLRPAPDSLRPASLNILAVALMCHYDDTGLHEDLDEAIRLNRENLTLCPGSHPLRRISLINVANGMSLLYERSARIEDLEEAIHFYREGLLLSPPDHAHFSFAIHNLGRELTALYEHTRNRETLDEAIALNRKALSLHPASHPFHGDSLYTLGKAMHQRFLLSGQREDLDNTIMYIRECITLFPPEDPWHHGCITNLGLALSIRYEQSEEAEDLEEILELARKCLDFFPPAKRLDPLDTLAKALVSKYKRLGRIEDLEEAISLHREAVTMRTSPHPSHCMSLSNLADSLNMRYRRLGNYDDWEQAIVLLRDGYSSYRNSPLLHHICSNLAKLLFEKYRSSPSGEDDLGELICLHQQCIDALTPDNPKFCEYSTAMAETLVHAHLETGNDKGYLLDAINLFRIASHSRAAHISSRLRAASLWAEYAESAGHISVVEAYEQAIGLLPRLASLGQNVGKRHKALGRTDGLARRAAAAAIKVGMYGKAVEMLEAGRAVFWLQALQLRTPMDALREVAPDLEQDLSRISRELERGSHQDISRRPDLEHEAKLSLEKEASYLNELSDQWDRTLEKVRKLDGFREFLLPSKLSTLHGATLNGTVVFLLVEKSVSHALIMTPTEIHHLNLPEASETLIRKLMSMIREIAPTGLRADHDMDSTEGEPSLQRQGRLARSYSNETFADALKSLWDAVVCPVIRFLDLKKSKSPPIIRWCATGLFSFMPLHAAGIYTPNMFSVDSASDYIVSSYIPTVGALLKSKGRTPEINSFKMMVAIEPKTLPSTVQELQEIQKYVDSGSMVALGVPGSPASVEEVLAHLPTSSVVHFACHGMQSGRNPLESALVLNDGELKISQIMQQNLPNASLAFLCACETATGDENLPDESMHLGAALLFSGFSGVVATMWAINDTDGPVVAKEFYKYLFRDGLAQVPDTSRAAHAVHFATAKLRAQSASFNRWVPFIHIGF